jgi:hypothetical protein
MNTDEAALVTIDGAVKLIHEKTGVPVPKSRIHKDLAAGIAPSPDAVYGRRYLWRPEKMLAYAQRLIKPAPLAWRDRPPADNERGEPRR